MASPELTVTVTGGIPPIPIHVDLFKDGNHDISFDKLNSFTYIFNDLGPGSYNVFISGFNPGRGAGSTTCAITTEGITLLPTSDANPTIATGISYNTEFHFDIP